MRRFLGTMVVLLGVCGLVMGDETSGSIVKFEDDSVTIRTGGFGGFGGGKKGKSEEKVFKVSKDVKITRTVGKDKEEVKLTLDELKTAIKVTNVFVTIDHDGDNVKEIKIGGFRFGGGKGKRGKDKEKKDDFR